MNLNGLLIKIIIYLHPNSEIRGNFINIPIYIYIYFFFSNCNIFKRLCYITTIISSFSKIHHFSLFDQVNYNWIYKRSILPLKVFFYYYCILIFQKKKIEYFLYFNIKSKSKLEEKKYLLKKTWFFFYYE